MSNHISSLKLDERSFRRIAEVVHSECGIVINDSKRKLLISRLSKKFSRGFGEGLETYCDVLESKGGSRERRQLISMLTTNVTHFFRERHHFEALATDILPSLVNRAKVGGRVRIWSAGCSTGEEVYSIATTILSTCTDANKLNIKILGSDVDPDVLAKAKTGSYYLRKGEKVDWPGAEQYFHRTGETQIQVSSRLKEISRFAELNLMNEWPMRGKFDVVFCRNVAIYFDDETQDRLWQRFSDLLNEDGSLFLGHSERITDPSSIGLKHVGVTQYRRT